MYVHSHPLIPPKTHQLTNKSQNNPLHISIFPPHTTPYPLSSSSPKSTPPVHESLRTPLQYSLLLSSTLDIFDARSRTSGAQNLTGDLGLLYAVDERLAAYGFETNTGVRFVVFVDARGRVVRGGAGVGGAEGNAREGVVGGVREVDVRSVSFVFFSFSFPLSFGGREDVLCVAAGAWGCWVRSEGGVEC